MKTNKQNQMPMLAFRCPPPLTDALALVAKHNKLSRSSVIRLLLIKSLKENADMLIPAGKKKKKKPVDTKTNV